MKCEMVRELLPWYPGGLMPEEAAQVARHLRDCATCREELARVHALRTRVCRAVEEEPALRPEVWKKVALRTAGLGLGRLRLGSEMIGISLSLFVRGKTLPVRLELFLLETRVPIFEYAGGER